MYTFRFAALIDTEDGDAEFHRLSAAIPPPVGAEVHGWRLDGAEWHSAPGVPWVGPNGAGTVYHVRAKLLPELEDYFVASNNLDSLKKFCNDFGLPACLIDGVQVTTH